MFKLLVERIVNIENNEKVYKIVQFEAEVLKNEVMQYISYPTIIEYPDSYVIKYLVSTEDDTCEYKFHIIVGECLTVPQYELLKKLLNEFKTKYNEIEAKESEKKKEYEELTKIWWGSEAIEI